MYDNAFLLVSLLDMKKPEEAAHGALHTLGPGHHEELWVINKS